MLYQKGAAVFAEIHDQPQAWRNTLDLMAGHKDDFTAWFKAENFGQVIYVACSDSLNAALSAARITHLVSGLNSVAVPAAEVLYARRPPYDSRIKTLVLALGRPDEAEETGWALEKLRGQDQRAQVLGLESGEAALASLAHRSLALHGVHEDSKIGTRSVSCLLLASMVVTSWLSGRDALLNELVRVPDLVDFKPLQTRMQQVAQAKPAHVAFLGSGPFYGVACQGALNVREMAAVPCEHQYMLEYRHGSHCALTNLHMVVGLISNTFRVADEKTMMDIAVTRAQRMAVTEEATDHFRGRVDQLVELKAGVSEISRVLLSLPVLQLFAFYLALSKGINPDHPKHLEHQVLKLKEKPGAPPATA